MTLLETTQEVRQVRGISGGTAYSVYGAGRPVVLIHGVGMQQAIWAPQVLALASRYQVITYDMLGHGKSKDPDEDVTLADYGQQLHDLLGYLAVERPAVIGHSMGALVALELALRAPALVDRLVALNGAFNRTPAQRASVLARASALERDGIEATLDSTLARWFGSPVPDNLKSHAELVSGFLKDVHPVGYARSYRVFATSDALHVGRLHDLSMPALFITGELDPNSTPEMSQAMASQSPRATCVIVPGAKHKMPLTRANEINQRLLEFLEIAT